MRFNLFIISILLTSFLYGQKSSKNCTNHINGVVINQQTNKKMSNVIVFASKDEIVIAETKTDKNGLFSFKIGCNGKYQIGALRENFTKNIKLVFTSNFTKKHHVELKLFPLEEFERVDNKNRIIVKSIHFLPDSNKLTKDAKNKLDKVYNLLEKYEFISIQVAFHTDIRGNATYAFSLTQKRADICADYLIGRGIASNRIKAIGFGSTELLNHCNKSVKCSNEEHQVNRRSEFVVTANNRTDSD